MAEPPDEIAIEFGVKLSADVGAIIARTGGEANFKISLRWQKG
jgi:NTP-dependent ternary system trypsin peptidase co-occuring protein